MQKENRHWSSLVLTSRLYEDGNKSSNEKQRQIYIKSMKLKFHGFSFTCIPVPGLVDSSLEMHRAQPGTTSLA